MRRLLTSASRQVPNLTSFIETLMADHRAAIEKLKGSREFLDLVKFTHTLFALPFAMLGAALAAHRPLRWDARPRDWLGILLCMATARTAAMAFNRLVDRDIDGKNPRTAMRHLPSGKLSVVAVATFTAIACVGFVASTLLFLPNRWPIILSLP